MVHLPELIRDLALILGAAGIVTLLFRKLKQPVALGYIIAGFLVGPHFPVFPSVSEVSSIRIWADIGVIFVLFALGLEFSFRKLARIGGAASITAIIEVSGMVVLGYLVGRAFGWSQIDSIFLGGIISISSTTIIFRAFDELGVKGRGYVNLVFGVLIVEDLFAVLLMVLLSTVAITKTVSGTDLVGSSLKLLFFLTLWFLLGIFLLPSLLKRARPLINSETLLVVSVALCLLMVVLATEAGFSPALGAFVMGSMLAETAEGEKIEHLVRPVKDLFAAVFFVSVGMLFDPAMMLENIGPVLAITCAVMFGKIFGVGTGALAAGQGLRHAVQSGMSLAQIGEFSFIIATLGLSLKVTSEFLYPIAVSVSAITAFTTPYLIRSADTAHRLLSERIPPRWHEALNRYSFASKSLSTKSEWSLVVRSYLFQLVLNSVLIAAVFLGVAKYFTPFLVTHFTSEQTAKSMALIAALASSAPFLWALVMRRPPSAVMTGLWSNKRFRSFLLAVEVGRWVFALALFTVLATQFISVLWAIGISISLGLVSLLLFSRHLSASYVWFENRFVKNLSSRETDSHSAMPPLAPWDAHLVRLEIRPESHIIGRTLEELGIREKFGVTIALIERGNRKIAAPNRHQRLFPNDKVAIIGTDEQIQKFRHHIELDDPDSVKESADLRYTLKPVLIDSQSPYLGRTIRDSGIRENSQGLVVGVERNGERMLNPDSQLTIQQGDLLWIVGDALLLKKISDSPSPT